MDRIDTTDPVTGERPTAPLASRRSWPWLLSLGVVAALVILVLARGNGRGGLSPTEVSSEVQAGVAKGLEDARAAAPDSAVVYQQVLPSLVYIHANGTPDASGDVGTGVVIDEAGDILTARHVVADAATIDVTFADGTKSTARIAAQQPENDIAVLRAADGPQTIVPAVLGGGVQVGDAAYAVGHPLNLVGSLSAGVISGIDRSIPVGDGTTMNGLIQFDAAVNPGSSGGPLLNRRGQVVGIVTSLANPSGQGYFVGIGFAVPISTASGAAGGPSR